MNRQPIDRTKFTPAELAEKWGKPTSTIIALIRSGALRAIDISVTRGKPRFLIDLGDIAAFEEGCAVQPATRSRRVQKPKADPNFVEYF